MKTNPRPMAGAVPVVSVRATVRRNMSSLMSTIACLRRAAMRVSAFPSIDLRQFPLDLLLENLERHRSPNLSAVQKD